MTLEDAMREACAAAGVKAPARAPSPGRWWRADTTDHHGKGDASILIFDDRRGGLVWNWQTAIKTPFRVSAKEARPLSFAERRRAEERRRRDWMEAQEAANTALRIVQSARTDRHAYLAAKGFPDERGLVHDRPYTAFPRGDLGRAMAAAMPEGEGPWLIVPGRFGSCVMTVQFIGPDGAKKNLLRGRTGGTAHRIATGGETWVCEGIATAMTVRAALRFLGRSATVLCAFSASNASLVATSAPGAVVMAADNDKPIDTFGGLGTGEWYARRSGRAWTMPPERGDWNDFHQAHGLRAVALKLKETSPA